MQEKSGSVIGLINSFAGGGAERQMGFLLEQGIVEKVYTLENNQDYTFKGQIIPLLKWLPTLPTVMRFLLIPKFAILLAFRIKKNQTVISFTERSNFVNILASWISGHRTLVSVRTNPEKAYQGKKSIVGVLAKLLYRRADMIITNSSGAKEYIQNFYKINSQKVMVAYNGIDADAIRMQSIVPIASGHESIFAKGPVCIIVGRFEKPKGHIYAIRAFKRVISKIPNAQLLLVGEGALRNELKDVVKHLGLESSVHFIGFQKNPFSYIVRSHMLILPSLWEGMPNVVLESIACGTPVVATDCNFGPREILSSVFPKALVPPFSEHALQDHALSSEEILLADAVVAIVHDMNAKESVKKFGPEILARFSKEQVLAVWRMLTQ